MFVITVVLFFVGLFVGSFLGVVTYRLPRGLEIVFDRSRCSSCKKVIAWYDNIPLLSFLVLGGKCRKCGARISFREPLIELVTGIVFAFVGLNIFNLIFACLLISIFVIDLEEHVIPDRLVFLGLVFLLLKFLISDSPFLMYLLAGFICADLLLFLNLITKGKGMGLGDVKLALFIGSIVGLRLVIPFLFFSFVVGAIVGIILMLFKKATIKQEIAFGPFLIIGCVLSTFLGQFFLNYLGIK